MTEPLSALGRAADHSWLEQLTPDPEAAKYAPNKTSRQVRSGHYIPVMPTPLPKPSLIIHSPPMAQSLGISEEEVKTDAFAGFFAGEQHRVPALKSWCTPYALSIMGTQMTSNCPFGNGNGYGDGRAASIGEVVVDGQRWEMQLKGGGTTPFCRGADGRAVLRSSIREFLASEAMFHLGIDTTRALSLVLSGEEASKRPWYSQHSTSGEPDKMIIEPCAITTRVAPSFLRVGHVDLFARRAGRRDATDQQKKELEQMVSHAIFREYADCAPGKPLPERAQAMLVQASEKFGLLVGGWLRVGFCQGNFNADNCLISGRTMDYGPFGWMDEYDPLFAKWVGSGQHFAFMNQPDAAVANYFVFFNSVAKLLDVPGNEAQKIFETGAKTIKETAIDAFRQKLGFATKGSEVAMTLFQDLEPLMRRSRVDYTIFWRQLAAVAELEDDGADLFEPLKQAFYSQPCKEMVTKYTDWLQKWRSEVAQEGSSLAEVATRMRKVNPKYVPREWMLADCYSEASKGNYALVHELYSLFRNPYDEQPEFEAKYYRLTDELYLKKGGIAKMS